MRDIIKAVRRELGLSQEGLAEALNVSFTSVNRWENGRSLPGDLAQSALFSLCEERGVDAFAIVLDTISSRAAAISLPEDRMLLYHGSRSGITGPIQPNSRSRCDFGRGFYLGTLPMQALTLIADAEGSKFYFVSLATAGLTVAELPTGLDWALTIALHRGKMEGIRNSSLYAHCAHLLDGADVAVGAIADDRMFFVLDQFFQGTVTDAALVACLSALSLGTQYVALTQRACDALRIEGELELPLFARLALVDAAVANRERGIALANGICREHRREGLFFDEILSRGYRA